MKVVTKLLLLSPGSTWQLPMNNPFYCSYCYSSTLRREVSLSAAHAAEDARWSKEHSLRISSSRYVITSSKISFPFQRTFFMIEWTALGPILHAAITFTWYEQQDRHFDCCLRMYCHFLHMTILIYNDQSFYHFPFFVCPYTVHEQYISLLVHYDSTLWHLLILLTNYISEKVCDVRTEKWSYFIFHIIYYEKT